MKFSEVVGIHSYFQDVFDMMDEHENYWKRFISNEMFEDILNTTLDCLTNSSDDKKKSVWVQGAYGTGKSHSTSVVKHLLSDEFDLIQDYIDQIGNVQLRQRLSVFRSTNRVFPVVLKGVNSIVDSLDLCYVIQNAVTNALSSRGIELTTTSDFSQMIERLDEAKLNGFWESALESNQELSMYANNINDLKQELANHNKNVLRILTNELKQANLIVGQRSIEKWLKEVLEELRGIHIADQMVIFWDEFTSVLELNDRRSLLTQIQNIAELSKTGVYLYIVSHKKMDAILGFKELKEDERTMAKDRFREKGYDMQPTTTYHIISSAILKHDEEKWAELKQSRISENIELVDLIHKLTQNTVNSGIVKEKMQDIYPIHPYTAYLATFVSRNIGSTERSIFKFLNNEERGFKHFLQNKVVDKPFLSAEYIWDFFVDDFEQDTANKFDSVTNKYKLYINQIDPKGEIYVNVFKVVLLLNILYKMTMTLSVTDEKSFVVPSEENITLSFRGVYNSEDVRKVLDYIDNNQIIYKSPEGIFEIAFTSLPPKQIQDEKNKEYRKYEDVTKLLDQYTLDKDRLVNQLKRAVPRELEVKFFWGGESEHLTRNRFSTAFTRPNALSIAVALFRGETKNLDDLISRQEKSLAEALNTIINISKQADFKNIAFIAVHEPLGEKRLEGYVEHIAHSIVAKNHSFANEKVEYETKAAKWIKGWVDSIINSSDASVIFRGKQVNKPFKLLCNYFAEDLSKVIFFNGLEKLNLNTETIWKKQNSKAAIECFVFPDSRTELEEKLVGNMAYLRNIVKNSSGDYIINEKMAFRENTPEDHVLYIICQKVEEIIEASKGKSVVNLGDILKPLNEPPYGLYQNIISMATMSFALRTLINKIYKEGTGKLADKNIIRDTLVSLFNYWKDNKEKDKLYFRFSTDEERELVEQLKKLFGLEEAEGLIKTKWALREKFASSNNSPLWALKYLDNSNQNLNTTLDKLFEFTIKVDQDIQQADVCELLELIKNNFIDISLALSNLGTENGLNAYFMQIAEANINEADIPQLIVYLDTNLHENKAFWEEEKVHQLVWKWLAIRNTPPPGPNPNPNPPGGGEPPLPPQPWPDDNGDDSTDEDTEQQILIEKITNYQGSYEDFKHVIITVVKENPSLIFVIRKYLD